MTAVGELLLKCQLHELLCGRAHILKALSEGHDSKAHVLQVLNHLDCSPAVESYLANIEALAEAFDEFLDITIMDDVAFGVCSTPSFSQVS